MSTSTRNHVTFHTPCQSDLSRHSPKKKILLLSDNSINNSSKGRKRRSVVTINTETDVCSTKASINKRSTKRASIYTIDNIENIREDAYGNSIIKGKKNHKVTFIDNVTNKNIAEVILVDDISPKKRKKDNNECKCQFGCLVF